MKVGDKVWLKPNNTYSRKKEMIATITEIGLKYITTNGNYGEMMFYIDTKGAVSKLVSQRFDSACCNQKK